MKKVLSFVTFLSLCSVFSVAQNSVKKFTVQPFEKLTIDANVKVMLVEGDQPLVSIRGDQKIVEKIKVVQSLNKLRIVSSYRQQNSDEVVVIVHVKNLQSITVNSNADILSIGSLESVKLNILLDAECLLAIINSGKTNVRSGEEYEISAAN